MSEPSVSWQLTHGSAFSQGRGSWVVVNFQFDEIAETAKMAVTPNLHEGAQHPQS